VDLIDEDSGPTDDLAGCSIDEDSASRDLELALSKTRRLRADRRAMPPPQKRPKLEPEEEGEELPFEGRDFDAVNSNIVLYSTSEFCRSLGDIPTYGQAGNRDSKEDETVEFDLSELNKPATNDDDDDEAAPGAWQSVEIDSRPVEIETEDKPVLDDEPVVNNGIAGALLLASKKGYLDNKLDKVVATSKKAIEAINYSIEDKRYDDLDEKYNRKRDRYSGSGMTLDFKEKEGYKPDIKLEYVDDHGRTIPPKEAFRALSHRFHGKGSGKKKTEKRMKKAEEEQLMKSMHSTDTPLNTVHLLKERQKLDKTPYVVLTGGKGIAANNIAK
jgi:U4/U6.U5 tri-snRNP-associated protein 1